MASCSFAKTTDSPCEGETFTLESCNRDISKHLAHYKMGSSTKTHSEIDLILARAYMVDADINSFTLCSRHRTALSTEWRRCNRKCALLHDVGKTIARGLSIDHSYIVPKKYKDKNDKFPPGYGICTSCYKQLCKNASEVAQVSNISEPDVQLVQESEDDPAVGEPNIQIEQESEDNIIISEHEMEDVFTYDTRSVDLMSENSQNCDTETDVQPSSSQDSYMEGASSTMHSSQISGESETDQINQRKLLLDQFLLRSGFKDGSGSTLQSNWFEIGQKMQRNYTNKAFDILQAGLSVIVPGQEEQVTEAFFLKHQAKYTLGMDEYANSNVLEILMTVYEEADTWKMRRLILSIIAPHYSLEDMKKYSPNITKYMHTEARRHALNYGSGKLAPDRNDARINCIDDESLEHFIQYLFSPSVSIDCPFGEKKLTLKSGDSFKVPAIILRTVRTQVVRMYILYCKDNGYAHHSARTYMRVLEAIGPSVRKQMRGLDNYAAEGAEGYEDLLNISHQVFKEEEVHDIKIRLKQSKNYLKTEYKTHLSSQSTIISHCITHALNDFKNKNHFYDECGHVHSDRCQCCDDAFTVLEEFESKVGNVSDELAVTIQQSVLAIREWWSHSLRTVNQDRARTDILEKMSTNEILLEADWAMKLLPMWYREPMSKFFAAKGICWHVSVLTSRDDDGELKTLTLVHAFNSVIQDSEAAVAILDHAVSSIKTMYPHITKVHVKADNAGCYHSNATIAG